MDLKRRTVEDLSIMQTWYDHLKLNIQIYKIIAINIYNWWSRVLQLAYFPYAGNYAPVPTRGGKQDDYISLAYGLGNPPEVWVTKRLRVLAINFTRINEQAVTKLLSNWASSRAIER